MTRSCRKTAPAFPETIITVPDGRFVALCMPGNIHALQRYSSRSPLRSGRSRQNEPGSGVFLNPPTVRDFPPTQKMGRTGRLSGDGRHPFSVAAAHPDPQFSKIFQEFFMKLGVGGSQSGSDVHFHPAPSYFMCQYFPSIFVD